jgi:hypothetical protein
LGFYVGVIGAPWAANGKSERFAYLALERAELTLQEARVLGDGSVPLLWSIRSVAA